MEDLLSSSGTVLYPEDVLIFPKHKRAFAQYVDGADGQRELHLHYRTIEIVFDEPELFAFGEALIEQSEFAAGSARGWGGGFAWSRVKPLLEELVQNGVLWRADGLAADGCESPTRVPSPLPAAEAATPHTWLECEALSRELTGRTIELGHLELLVPLYRVCHAALDREGRQVGEASVFPGALRLDVETEWRSCQYPGSRFQDEYPFNLTALKSMLAHWQPVRALTAAVRAHYLARFPAAVSGYSVLDAYVLACLAMGVPGYAMLRARGPIANGELHPALSSLARITDGVRMTASDLLSQPETTAPQPWRAPLDAVELLAVAERRNLMLSSFGVCAAPQKMIETYLSAFFHGEDVPALEPALESEVQALDRAFDYGLRALRLHAQSSMIWAPVAETFQRLCAILSAELNLPLSAIKLRQRLEQDWSILAGAGLATERERSQYCALYADLWTHCGQGLALDEEEVLRGTGCGRSETAEPVRDAAVSAALRDAFVQRGTPPRAAEALASVIHEHLEREQRMAAAAEREVAAVNAILGRPQPRGPVMAELFTLGHRLRHPATRMPSLFDALHDELGLQLTATAHAIRLEC